MRVSLRNNRVANQRLDASLPAPAGDHYEHTIPLRSERRGAHATLGVAQRRHTWGGQIKRAQILLAADADVSDEVIANTAPKSTTRRTSVLLTHKLLSIYTIIHQPLSELRVTYSRTKCKGLGEEMNCARNGEDVALGATADIRIFLAVIVVLVLSLGGCAGGKATGVSGTISPASTHRPHPIVPFNDAITSAAEQMFQSFAMDGDNGTAQLPFVIDPLIDGATGAQSKGTTYIQDKVIALTTAKQTRFKVQPFVPNALNSKPLVLIGTLNTINPAAEMKGNRTSWWICLVLVDMKSGKVVGRGVALAQLDGVDITPLDYFRDSPAWTEDAATSSYVSNCLQSKVGDLVDQKYLSGLFASASIAQAIEAYNKGQYQQALDLYQTTAARPGGDQLRLYVGLYLTNQKLGNRTAEDEAFRRLVDFGLAHKRLAIKFLFRPGSTLLVSDQTTAGPYEMWLHQIAQEAVASDTCLEVTGHTTPTGLAPANRDLSVLRAEYIKDRLDTIEPPLAPRTIANGVGSRENLVGIGKDDDSDALDRRVEFKVIQTACSKQAEPEQYNVY